MSEYDKLNETIKQYFNENLISSLLFGSSCRNKAINPTSDLDFIIILKEKVKDQAKISRALKKELSINFPLVAFNIYDKETFPKILKENKWLTLSISLGHHIIVDKDNFFKKTLEININNLQSEKISPLGWKIKEYQIDSNLEENLYSLASRYNKSSLILFEKEEYLVAFRLLLQSLHYYLSSILLRYSIFITKGEIVQCFLKFSAQRKLSKYREGLLEFEQLAGLLDGISFDFKSNGKMDFLRDNKVIKELYQSKYKLYFRFLTEVEKLYGKKVTYKRNRDILFQH